MRNIFKVLIIFILISIVSTLTIELIRECSKIIDFKTSGIIVDGEILEYESKIEKDSNGKMVTYYYPVFTFNTLSNDTITKQAYFGSSTKSYDIGDIVEIIYIKEKPSEAKINSFFSIWIDFLLTLFFYIVFVAIVFFMFKNLIKKMLKQKNTNKRVNNDNYNTADNSKDIRRLMPKD